MSTYQNILWYSLFFHFFLSVLFCKRHSFSPSFRDFMHNLFAPPEAFLYHLSPTQSRLPLSSTFTYLGSSIRQFAIRNISRELCDYTLEKKKTNRNYQLIWFFPFPFTNMVEKWRHATCKWKCIVFSTKDAFLSS